MSQKSEIAEDLHNLPGLLPLLPMLYVAWSDGILTPSELAAIRDRLNQQDWLTEAEKKVAARWLDPATPPAPPELLGWLNLIRSAKEQIPEPSRRSLVDLGVAIVKIGAQSDSKRCTSPEACAALRDVEGVLGIATEEAARDLLGLGPSTKSTPGVKSSFKISAMTKLLDGDHAAVRNKVRKLLLDPIFRYQYGLATSDYRERVLSWCRELARQGLGALSYPEECGGKADLGAFIAAFETLAFHDFSLVVKFGVQFGLFGGSILNLGTKAHHEKYLRDVGTLDLPGCFAMTELGHGSNVRDLETTADYDKETDEFVVHTPSNSGHKEYIGNAAQHGEMATVFAQLRIGADEHGVHAFLVPIRQKDSSLMPGVRIEDSGEKLGLNGVDNGRLWFDHVRIPRQNLLNRFAEVSKNGDYSSPIASASQRFFTMLGTLVGGRISVAAAALSASKSALTIAIRYAARRRQFGASGVAETLLLDYPSHQRRLLPLLANAYALDFAIKHLGLRYVERTENDAREIEVLAAAVKAFATWNATETIQVCRECCGGQGYLAVNRLAALKADTDVFTTFEGDNTVLMQLVAKGLLTEFRQQFNEMKFGGVIKYLTRQAGTAISELNPVVTRLTDEQHLRDKGFQLSALQYREKDLLASAARRLKKRIDLGMDSFEAFVDCQDHLINLAKAFVERVVLEQFHDGIARVSESSQVDVLERLSALFALHCVEKDKGWFLENGYIEGGKARAIRRQVEKLCVELRRDAVALVDAFGIPDACLGAPIATKA